MLQLRHRIAPLISITRPTTAMSRFDDDRLPHQDLRAPARWSNPTKLHSWWHSWRLRRVTVLLVADVWALALAWKVAAHLNRRYSPLPPQLDWGNWAGLPGLFWLFAIVSLGVLAQGGLYGSPRQQRDYVRSGQLVSLVYLLGLVLQYFYDPRLAPPRSLVLVAWLGSVLLIVALRLVVTAVLAQREQHRRQVRVFLIAPAPRLAKLAQRLGRQPHYRVVGAAFSSMAKSSALLKAIDRVQAQEVLVESLPETELASDLYWQLRRSGIVLRLIPSSVEMLHRRGQPEIFAGVPTLRMEPPLLGGVDYLIKCYGDRLLALGLLILLLPLLGLVALLIVWTSPGPVFFRQERVGLYGKPFRIWKFRTMGVDAAQRQAELEVENITDGVMFKLKADPRVTGVGGFLRRSSIDELPQLINVMLGQMSLVGPRPLPVRDVARFDPWHHVRHRVLPGITGLWQVSGRSTIDEFNDAARLDLYYIDYWSLNLDLEILLETVRIVLFGWGAY
jgi:exopolysaccharide biosynthesis polyprenyl glycosylphosphotransferase